MTDIVPLPSDYAPWLAELKTRIHKAQQRAARSVQPRTGAALLADRPRHP